MLVISLIPGLLMLWPSAPTMLGGFYLLAAIALGLGLVWRALQLIRSADKAAARAVYKYSSAYLAHAVPRHDGRPPAVQLGTFRWHRQTPNRNKRKPRSS